MIKVNDFNSTCAAMSTWIGAKGYIICSTEQQATGKLKDKAGVILVAVYPGYSFDGEQDAYRDMHELLFYAVEKENKGASDQTQVDQYDRTQQAMIKLKEYLFGETELTSWCKPFPYLVVPSVEIDPEYNVFGGYLGWSIKAKC